MGLINRTFMWTSF